MAQSNKVCQHCGLLGHSKFYCPTRPKTAIKIKKPLKASRAIPTHGRVVTPIIAKKKKTPTRSKLVKELDRVFSIFIRLRDKDKPCVTCPVRKEWKEMQNCHFYSRGKIPTRWDEYNCHSGCYRCNVLLKGNYIEYTKYMIDTYGREFVDDLGIKANSGVKIPTSVIVDMIAEYKAKVDEMLAK